MTRVYLGLGSNLGDRYGRLIEALDRLQTGVAIDAISSIYETAPWGYADQPRFLNAVCGGETDFGPRECFSESDEIPSFRTQRSRAVPAKPGGIRVFGMTMRTLHA